MREFEYVNGYGIPKKLVVGESQNGKYPVTLWSMDTGDFCGNGELTPEQLNRYLEHFGIKERT